MKICFINLQAAPLLDQQAKGGIGGAEVRSVTFAKGLAAAGRHDVHFIVRGTAARDPWTVDRVTVHVETPPPLRLRARQVAGNPALLWKLPMIVGARYGRSIRKRLFRESPMRPKANPVYRGIGAAVYCCFGVNNTSAHIVRSASRARGKSLLFLASDNDLCHDAREGSRNKGPFGEIGHLCHYVLMRADRIVVQTPWQQQALMERYARRSTIIRNPIDTAREKPPEKLAVGEDFALWIGREDSFAKRPDRCIELARRCPDVPLVMIVNKKNQDTFDVLVRTAPSNVTIIERVPFDQIEAYFQAASVLVNTSTLEGFPNTFLQAGKYGIPILSWTVDPGEMLSRHQSGLVAGEDMGRMAEGLRNLLFNTEQNRTTGKRARQYVERFHAVDDRVAELECLLAGLVANNRTSQQGHRKAA